MAYSTKLLNMKYANVGNVKIIFDDDTDVTHNITSIDDDSAPTSGTWYDQNSSRSPVVIEAMGQNWKVEDLPAEVTYPNSEIGTISQEEVEEDLIVLWRIWLDKSPQ